MSRTLVVGVAVRALGGAAFGRLASAPLTPAIAAPLRLRLRDARRRRHRPFPVEARGGGDRQAVGRLLPGRAPARNVDLGYRCRAGRDGDRGGRAGPLPPRPAGCAGTKRRHRQAVEGAARRGGIPAGRHHLRRPLPLPLRSLRQHQRFRRRHLAGPSGRARRDVCRKTAGPRAAEHLRGAARQQDDDHQDRRARRVRRSQRPDQIRARPHAGTSGVVREAGPRRAASCCPAICITIRKSGR